MRYNPLLTRLSPLGCAAQAGPTTSPRRFNGIWNHLFAAVKGYVGVSMSLKQMEVATQNNGVVDPFLKGHGDSRYPVFPWEVFGGSGNHCGIRFANLVCSGHGCKNYTTARTLEREPHNCGKPKHTNMPT